jgi:hypothetical protein
MAQAARTSHRIVHPSLCLPSGFGGRSPLISRAIWAMAAMMEMPLHTCHSIELPRVGDQDYVTCSFIFWRLS